MISSFGLELEPTEIDREMNNTETKFHSSVCLSSLNLMVVPGFTMTQILGASCDSEYYEIKGKIFEYRLKCGLIEFLG